MRLGIIGLSGAGKTTVYNAVSGGHAATGGFGRPNEIHRAMVKIPDPRLEQLSRLLESRLTIPAEIEFLDFPPPAKAEQSSGNIFPASLRECAGVVAVLNCFDPPPGRSLRERLGDLLADMILSDLVIAEKRMVRLEKNLARGVKMEPGELPAVKKAVELLSDETSLRDVELSDRELTYLRSFAFLSLKPLLVVLNTGEGDDVSAQLEDINNHLGQQTNTTVASLCGKIEMELSDLSDADREVFLADFGISEPAIDKLIRLAYQVLDLITFFTGAEKESRAWPIKRGTTAVDAAAEIHEDIKRGFIRAEVVPVAKLLELGGMVACRKQGAVRLEGRDYIIADGDYTLYRFNI